jgi:hypothetical protein
MDWFLIDSQLQIPLALKVNRYAEYYFSDNLIEETGSPEGTVLAVRRVQKKNKIDGFFTVVGCFHCDDVLDEASARRVDGGNTLGRASIRSDDAFNLPHRVLVDLNSYATAAQKKGRKYFVKLTEYPPTPQPQRRQRPPSPQCPHTAGSDIQQSTKRRHTNTADSKTTLRTPMLPTPKTNRQLADELKVTIQSDLEQQRRIERDIKSMVNRIKSIKSIEQKVLRADALQCKIQADLEELARLDRHNYQIDGGESTIEVIYHLDEAKPEGLIWLRIEVSCSCQNWREGCFMVLAMLLQKHNLHQLHNQFKSYRPQQLKPKKKSDQD